jgi:poly(A) polymerase
LIKRFIRKVFGIGRDDRPTIVPLSEHGIRRDQISNGARKVCDILQQSGFAAYVVGGAVRDLLLGIQPKDYDVATDATPDQVHRAVKRSRLIGRRFKLVHALFGEEVVEVSTFRAGSAVPDGEAQPSDRLVDEHGRVLRDNVFGTRAQDAARRDFTINALYYDPATETVLDYHHGVADLRKRLVRIIGDPAMRFREDPVRMLRAVRFAAKLDFKIEPKTRAPIKELAPLIRNVPAARLFEEMLKLLLSGHAAACLQKLRHEGLHHGLLPMLDVIIEQPLGERFVDLALEQTDKRIREDKPVSPAFLFAALLWHEVLAAWKKQQEAGARPILALQSAMDAVLDGQTDMLAIPRRLTATMKEIWSLQPRFENRTGRRPFVVLTHPRFRASLDFLALRAESGEAPRELVEWWSAFQTSSSEEREALLMPQAGAPGPRRRRRRRRTGARGAREGAPGDGEQAVEEPAGDASDGGRH